MEAILRKIRDYADKAHGDQTRKYTPDKYIVHPIRVMEQCQKYDERFEILAAALLHDVVEDTDITLQEMEDFLDTLLPSAKAKEITKLVEELTDVYTKADYPHLNRKERKDLETKRLQAVSPEAQTIKYADLIDNCIDIMKHDRAFGKKFQQEAKALLKLANKGNQQLYKQALEVITKA